MLYQLSYIRERGSLYPVPAGTRVTGPRSSLPQVRQSLGDAPDARADIVLGGGEGHPQIALTGRSDSVTRPHQGLVRALRTRGGVLCWSAGLPRRRPSRLFPG